jgi:hypothetical protein
VICDAFNSLSFGMCGARVRPVGLCVYLFKFVFCATNLLLFAVSRSILGVIRMEFG